MREQVRRETSGVQVPDSIRSDLPEGASSWWEAMSNR